MDSDEREIFNFLKTTGKDFVNAKEICRRAAGKARFRENPDWAKPYLQLMAERGLLEINAQGHFRIKPKSKHGAGRWMSPDIAKLLQEKGIQVEGQTTDEIASDEHYEQL
jgi:hypothetical protein